MDLKQLQTTICEQIKEKLPAIQTCSSYPKMRSELMAPACFVEVSGFELGTDPGTEELALVGTFEARIVLDRTFENAEFGMRDLAVSLAHVINGNTWDCAVSPAKIKDIGPDAFKPELDAFLVWTVTWTHEFHVGSNVWKTNGLPPHSIVVNEEIVI